MSGKKTAAVNGQKAREETRRTCSGLPAITREETRGPDVQERDNVAAAKSFPFLLPSFNLFHFLHHAGFSRFVLDRMGNQASLTAKQIEEAKLESDCKLPHSRILVSLCSEAFLIVKKFRGDECRALADLQQY